MVEEVTNNYIRVLEIRLLYHFWTKQPENFRLLSEAELKERISSYDSRSFFTIKPTEKTKKKLKEQGWIYKNTSLGCIIAYSDDLLDPFENVELKFLLNPLSEDLAKYSGKNFSRYEEEELKRYKKILFFSNKQNNAVTEDPEEKEHSYIFREKSTFGDFIDDPQRNIYAASVRKKDEIYHSNKLLDDDLPADTFALIQFMISMNSDKEGDVDKATKGAGRFGDFLEINFERFNSEDKKKLNSNDEINEFDTGDSLLQKIKNSLSGR
ncbi:MAG: hypothetical protein D3922_07485 [Candidatus Electrothrix sp. AR1]|nr:hypothetical protein [Candidatus Electrothrix sp. AR1]